MSNIKALVICKCGWGIFFRKQHLQTEKCAYHYLPCSIIPKGDIMVLRDLSKLPPDTPLRKSEVLSILPISRATFDNGVVSGIYPKPVYLGPKIPTWRMSDIMDIAKNGFGDGSVKQGVPV